MYQNNRSVVNRKGGIARCRETEERAWNNGAQSLENI